jgi:multiple sugar transport system substrate-binding protein
MALTLCALVLTGASCFRSEELAPPQPVTLTIWRTADSEDAFDAIVAQYQSAYPYVDFDFRVLRPDEYEEQLFAAWARGEGPDIFSVPNWRMGKFRDVIAPMPENVTLRTVSSEPSRFGGSKTIVEENTVQQLAASQMENLFAGPVASDVIFDEQIYGLPLSIDTLVMYYNRDMLSRAGVAVAPTTWNEFVNVVQANGLVQFDEDKNIVQAAASFGGTTTVPYFFDLLSVLMMQNGVTMTEGGSVIFSDRDNLTQTLAAMSFYTSFSDPSKATYTWNENGQDGLEAFIQGTSAMYFGYYRDQERIEQRATGLNFSRTKLPQVDPNNPVNYATYPVETVHIQSPNADHAWNFLRFAAASDEQSTSFLEETQRVPALRTLVGEAQQDPDIGIFAQQTLTAQSWYHGVDPDSAISAVQSMIETAVAGRSELEDIVNVGAKSVGLTMNKQTE